MQKETFLTLVLLACCVALIRGLPTSSRVRCLCRGSGMRTVDMDRVAKVEYHKPSSSCVQEELLMFFKNNRRRCLNLNEDQGRKIKQAIMENRNSNQGNSS